jgi:hypothetical protein
MLKIFHLGLRDSRRHLSKHDISTSALRDVPATRADGAYGYRQTGIIPRFVARQNVLGTTRTNQPATKHPKSINSPITKKEHFLFVSHQHTRLPLMPWACILDVVPIYFPFLPHN